MNPDFEAMTVEEIIEWKTARKAEVVAIQERMRAAEAVCANKLARERIIRSLLASGVEEAVALDVAGSVLLTPPPAIIGTEGGQPS